MTVLGQKGRSDRRPAASRLPRQTDYFRTRPDFTLEPERDITRTADFGRKDDGATRASVAGIAPNARVLCRDITM
jgi:hypothetical protein